MPTVTMTFDAWLGNTTITTTFDAMLQKTNSATTNFDAYLTKTLYTTFDALIVDNRGTFRGTGSEADRDLIDDLQPGDTFITTDPT